MGRQSIRAGFNGEHLASDTEVNRYDPMDGPFCMADHFHPDLAATPGMPWNISVIEVFV